MKVIFIVLALLSLHWFAFKLEAAKDLRETVPKGEEGITSQNDIQSKSKIPVLPEYKNSVNSGQEKSPLNNFQPDPNQLLVWGWKHQNGADEKKEKLPQNSNFKPEPDQLLVWGWKHQNGGDGEKEKIPQKYNFQPDPNQLLVWGWKHLNGADGEKEKIPQNNNFQPDPNQLLVWGWKHQNGAEGEKEKIPQKYNFQSDPDQLLVWGWKHQNGADGEKEKIPQKYNFQPDPNQLLVWGWKHQNGADGEKEKIPQNNNFQPEPDLLVVWGWKLQNGAEGEKKKIPQNNNFQPEPNQLLVWGWKHQNGADREKEKIPEGNDIIRLPSMKGNMKKDNSPFITFFTKNDLKAGNKLRINLRPFNHSSQHQPLLSRKQAESYPFSYKQFEHLLHLFSVAPKSPQAKAMDETLNYCEAEPLRIETKFCATSFEAMLDFVSCTLGLDSKNVKAISTMHLTKPKNKVQNYTITEEPKELATPKLIACHRIPYPYMVFYCHSLEHTKGFRVSLVGENGDAIETVAVCHFDTSEWSPEHVAFHEVGGKPGSTEVCHFSPSAHLLWLPLQA